MMTEHIEREALLDALYDADVITFTGMKILEKFPAADVQPVKHGKWHSRFYFRESTKAYDCEMRVCSICGSEWSYDAETGVSDYNYCPNCGAKMDGET